MKDEGSVGEINSMKKTSSVFEEKDVITNVFKGRIRQIMKFKGSDGVEKVKENLIDSFAAIMVRVIGYKELYEAWENQYTSQIDDFKESDQISSTQAVQTEWLELVPKVLCLQLNRLDYTEME